MFSEDVSAFFTVDGFADTAIHTAEDGIDTIIQVIVTQNTELLGEYAETTRTADTMLIRKAQIAAVVGETILIQSGINAGTWTLRRLLNQDEYMLNFEVIK